MKFTKQTLKKIIKEELEATMNEAELNEGMGPDHPDYDKVAGMITMITMSVLMKGVGLDQAIKDARVPQEHVEYVRKRALQMMGK